MHVSVHYKVESPTKPLAVNISSYGVFWKGSTCTRKSIQTASKKMRWKLSLPPRKTHSNLIQLSSLLHRRNHVLNLFILFCFLGPHPRYLEAPRLGVQSELQLLSYTTATATPDLSQACDLHHSSRQHRILNPLSEARDQNCVPMYTSDSTTWATVGTPFFWSFFFFFFLMVKTFSMWVHLLFWP